MVVLTAIICFLLIAGAAAMILAYFTDHEAAGVAGCIEEGQVW